MTDRNQPDDKGEEVKKPKPPFEYDWRDPTKPRNPEDNVIVDGWRRRADGTFEKVEESANQNSDDTTENGQ